MRQAASVLAKQNPHLHEVNSGFFGSRSLPDTFCDSSMMKVTLNGQTHVCAAGMTLLDLALSLRLVPETVICEYNGDLCRGDVFAQTVLQDGDVVEWLHFMGGGDIWDKRLDK